MYIPVAPINFMYKLLKIETSCLRCTNSMGPAFEEVGLQEVGDGHAFEEVGEGQQMFIVFVEMTRLVTDVEIFYWL